MIYNKRYNLYVSKDGLVYYVKDDKLVLKETNVDRDGYLRITLSGSCEFVKEKKYRIRHIHRIVAETFIGEQPIGLVVDHIDRNRQNNKLTNLHYVTQKENAQNSKDMSGQNNPMFGKDAWAIACSRKTPDEIEAIRKSKSEKMKAYWSNNPEALERMRDKLKNNPSKLKGRKLSEEHRQKLKGRIPWNKGVKQKEVVRDECSL